MRALLLAVVLVGCGGEDSPVDGPSSSVLILSPVSDQIIDGDVSLLVRGTLIDDATGFTVKIDNVAYDEAGGAITNTKPTPCDNCTFNIDFAGTNIANGNHTITVEYHTTGAPSGIGSV